jgi:N-acylglucosamine 2-epimerase
MKLSVENKEYLEKWSKTYRDDLVNNILPFWLKNGLDPVNGGFYTCVNRNGSLMDSTKSVWFQGRAGFIFAHAYNQIEKKPEWLVASKSAIDFLEKYCFDTDGRMYFEVKTDGTPLRKRRYVYSETFAAIAFAEYALASGDDSYAQKALELYKMILKYKKTPGLLSPKYMDTLPMRGHPFAMILIYVGSCIRQVIQDEVLENQINDSLFEIENYLMMPEYKALLEMVGMNGELIDTNMGRTINPGHCIETAWFIFEEAKYRNWDKKLVKLATTILDWSWEWGWDKEFGGIINFRDCKGLPSQDYTQDMKFWWPQNETIIATLYAYLATNDEKYLNWHRQISDWTYKNFPDNEFGEWYGYLHRDGTVAQPAKGNLFKGPFHIPRMMIVGNKLCNEILANKNSYREKH